MICFDANILLEIILDRKSAEACREYIDSSVDEMAITMLSLDLVMHFAERNKLDLGAIEKFTRLFTWLPMTDDDGERAFRIYSGDDYEDALQISCSLREGCTTFVTLDHGLAKKYARLITVELL